MVRPWLILLAIVVAFGNGRAAAQEPLTRQALREAVAGHTVAATALFREFLALPNDALYPADIEALNRWMADAFGARGFDARLLKTAGSPALYAERRVAGAERTVLVYLQADGQPVDPGAWDQENPYLAVLKEHSEDGTWQPIPWAAAENRPDADWRIFARSAADSKGPMTQFLVAVELLDDLGFRFPYNLKVIVDTEEELGSPHLAEAVAENRELLAADLLLIFDGPPHVSNRPTVSFGARGIMTATLVTYGPRLAQHSGHYGNFLPNPVFDLARILASLKSPDGVVEVPGFYDGVVIGEDLREVLAQVPDDEDAILAAMGLARADGVAESLQLALQYPSLNVRGLGAAWIGAQSRTIIPPTATAELDIRLVRESDPARLIELLRRHIESLGYTVLDRAPTDAERAKYPRIASLTHELSYGAFRSDFDAAAGRMARAGMRFLYGEEPILIRTMGGSIPIAPLVDILGLPAATVPTVNMDNNQHSPNENIRYGSFIEGIVILMAVLSRDPG
jgi:acetylornithine deacetylase/succinyl-diaminopimelate desuccinylase-like protein